MKRICHMALSLLLGSALLAGNLWAADTDKGFFGNWGFGGRGPIGVTANFGAGSLTGKGDLRVGGQKLGDTEYKVTPIRFGVGASYAHPLSEMFLIGGFAELRLSITSSTLKLGTLFEFKDSSVLGLGGAVGPYFRFALWGKEKKGGLAFAPYFVLQFLAKAQESAGYKDQGLLAFGGGLRADVFINKLIGINLGFEVLGSSLDVKWRTSLGVASVVVPVVGAAFYGGVTLSF